MYMKLEFTNKLNIIREKRRLRAERDRTERENNINLFKQEESVPKKETANKHNMEDKKILLQKKLFFTNNPNLQQQQQAQIISSPNSSINKNKITHNNTSQLNTTTKITQINDNNCENISIIVGEIIPCAINKFYE